MLYRFSRTEEISRRLVLDIEAESTDAAKKLIEDMCYTGEFYDEAEIDHEEVIENWDELSYIDPDSGITHQIHL